MKSRDGRSNGLVLGLVLSMVGMAFISLSWSAPAGKKEPAAMITNLSGEVYLLRGGAPKRVKAELAYFLFPGDKLDVGVNGTTTLVYFQGCRQEVLKGKGSAQVLADKTKALGKTVVASTPLKKCGPPPTVEITPESSLAKGVLTLRGQVGITRLSPAETKVLNVNPTFSWSAPEPRKFTVALYDKILNKLWEGRTEGQEIKYPAELPPLQRGEMYRWSVNKDVYAYFSVAKEEEVKALEEKRKNYEMNAQSPSSDLTYLLLSALMYSEAGFNLEAANYYQNVLKLAPKSRQVHLRLAETYDRMGWREDAKKEVEEAKKLEGK